MERRGSSKVDRLPESVRDKLNELLRDAGITQKDARLRINGILKELDHPETLGKNDVSRYDQKMREVGAKLRQSREVARMWIGKLGAAPQGQVGNLVNEILRTLAFDLSLKLQDEELTSESMPEVVEMLRGLSLSAMRLEKAASENVKREEAIRQQERERVAEEMGEVARQAGISDETIRTIRRDVLRMQD